MNIASVEAIPIEVPLSKVFSGSGYRVASRDRKRLMEAIACVEYGAVGPLRQISAGPLRPERGS